MDLSIIIVNWNTRELLRDCLTSVFQNLYPLKAEVFVVDNNSNDGSAEMVASEFPQVHLICNAENEGFASANNTAMRLCRGKYVLLLNSDTIIHDQVLEKSYDYMEKNDAVGMVGCRVLNGDGSLQITCSSYPSLLNLTLLTSGLSRLTWAEPFDRYQMRRWDRRDARHVDVVSGCYMFCRGEAIQQVGLMDESFFFFGEETDWCRRFRNAGWTLAFAPVGEITHYGGGSCTDMNHRRDLLLTAGTVRLHQKYGGPFQAALCWLVLLFFNGSRALFWRITHALKRSEKSLRRRIHFEGVLKNFFSTWPVDGSRKA